MTTALAISHDDLPDIRSAQLPALYEKARTDLAACARIDECKDWADKHAALASYAKQADDDQLQQFCIRIQARAVRRCGELLQTFQAPKGGDRKSSEYQSGGAPTVISQRRAAEQAGMSKDQEVQAVRVANVPEDEFEAAIEQLHPATVTQLAAAGRKPIVPAADKTVAVVPGFADATNVLGTMNEFAAFCQTHDPRVVALALYPHEVGPLRDKLHVVTTWLAGFRTCLDREFEP